MEKADIDAAIILEAKIQERVRSVVNSEVERILVANLGKLLEAEKARMLMEVAVTIGQIMRTYEKQDRKPLWEAKPEDFGMTTKDLDSRSMRNMTSQEISNAIRKQEAPVQEGIPTAS